MHKREKIRKYAVDLLKNNTGINRIYANRPSPVMLEELPCIFVFFDSEPVAIAVGDKYNPKVYERKLTLSIDILKDDPVDDSNSHDNSQANEDFLDEIAEQVESCFAMDPYFYKNDPTYDPQNVSGGLLWSSVLLSTTPYNGDDAGETRILCIRLQFLLTYETDTFTDKKLSRFSEYNVKINRVGCNESTIDPTLTEAQGVL